MKKTLLILCLVIMSAGIVSAAEFDFSVGASPFLPLQGVQFEKEAAEQWQNAKRTQEESAKDRYDDMDSYEIQKLKQRTQINLNSTKTPQMVEENGQVKIEYK